MKPKPFKSVLKKTIGAKRYAALGRLRIFLFNKFYLLKQGCLHTKYDIVFYCEQPSHWQNISTVVELCLDKLVSSKILLLNNYKNNDYSSAIYPDGLNVFFGIGQSMLMDVNTRLLYTPYVGLHKSMKPQNAIVVHTLVSLTSLDGVYQKNMFDGYDYILCAGQHHITDFRRWLSINLNLQGKVLVPSGYPKMDLVLKEISAPAIDNPNPDVFTVVYAPTHVYSVNEDLASLRRFGKDIVELLLNSGCRVIFRPHPVSFRDQDKDLVNRIIESNSGNPLFFLDQSKNYIGSYAKANLMVTDLSGTGFTYSLSFLKPSLFFSSEINAEAGLQGIQFQDREKIGGVARSLTELGDLLEQYRNRDISNQISTYRDAQFFNVGSATEYIVDNLNAIMRNEVQADWVKL